MCTNYNEDDYKTVYTTEPEEETAEEAAAWDDRWKHTVSSKAAYLLGVPAEHFADDDVFEKEVYEELDKNKHARIVRNLCILRTAILRNSGSIHTAITHDLKNLSTLPEYIPQDSLRTLREDGIDIEKANYRLNNYTIDINEHLRNRINNCKNIFPDWVNWDYVKEIYLMPNGTKEAGVINESKRYQANRATFPFRMYINWGYNDCGNILLHDGVFMQKLYGINSAYFTDMSKVRDASEETKTSIYDFLRDSEKTSLLVDCENSDPYKLYAVLKNLDQKEMLNKITNIVLFDDWHTTDAWKILGEFTAIPVDYRQIDRVKENKSLVDQTLMITATKMVYTENVDSFILASSDSDYWALMKGLPDTRFLVMAEYAKHSPDIKEAMAEKGIKYCYMDDFCTGNIEEIKDRIFLKELKTGVESLVKIDLNDVIDEAILRTRMELTDDERNAYYKKMTKELAIEISDTGILTLVTKR